MQESVLHHSHGDGGWNAERLLPGRGQACRLARLHRNGRDKGHSVPPLPSCTASVPEGRHHGSGDAQSPMPPPPQSLHTEIIGGVPLEGPPYWGQCPPQPMAHSADVGMGAPGQHLQPNHGPECWHMRSPSHQAPLAMGSICSPIPQQRGDGRVGPLLGLLGVTTCKGYPPLLALWHNHCDHGWLP